MQFLKIKKLSNVANITFTVILFVQSPPQVFAGMADGLISVYTLVDDLPLEGEAYVCSHTVNKSLLGMEDLDPRQRPYPVKSIVPVRSGSEVWYTNGPGVLVIDSFTLQPIRRLDPYLPPSCVVSITCAPSFRGDEAVWCLDDHTNTLLMYHANSYQLCASYRCGDLHPFRDVFPIQNPAGVTEVSLHTEVQTQEEEPETPELKPNDTVTVIHSEDAGIQILSQQDSVDYCSISSSEFSSEHLAGLTNTDGSSSGVLSSLASSSSMPFSTDCEDADRAQDEQVSEESSPLGSADPATHSQSLLHLQALKVVPVNGTIWIPRYTKLFKSGVRAHEKGRKGKNIF